MVGWDGIEPPGPGFSVPPTAWRMPGKYQTYRASFLRADLLERAPKGLNPPPMVTNWWQSGSVNSYARRCTGGSSGQISRTCAAWRRTRDSPWSSPSGLR